MAAPSLASVAPPSSEQPFEPRHACQFYEDETHLFTVVASFVGSGLAAGEPALVIATGPHREALCAELQARGFDVDRAIAARQLQLLDAQETLNAFMLGAIPDSARFMQAIGALLDTVQTPERPGPVRLFGEMVDLLWRGGNPHGAIQLEELWNEIGKSRPFSLLCAYVMGNFYRQADLEGFERICEAHTHVVPTERYPAGGDDDAKLREFARLQQRAHALETELHRRKKLERALIEADRHKDEFLAMLGHELRNPLSPILTAVQLMRLRGDGGARECEVIERQARHLARMVDDLLDVSRITRGKLVLHKDRLELSQVIAAAVETVQPLIDQRGHTLTLDLPGEALGVDGDPVRLAQALGNLLTNAARYTEPGGKISVSARREGSEWVVRVADNGIGLSAEALPRVFELFVQVGRTGSVGGLGVGLALVRNLIQLHGGSVTAASEGVGKGATFELRLPALAAPSEAAPAADPAAPVRSSSLRILVVDDNEDAAELLAEGLRESGHQVSTAFAGPQALELARDLHPNTVLLDIGLPGMDGYELATRLRETLSQAPPRLIAITGFGQEADRLRSRAAGIDHHLAKPVDLSELESLLFDPNRDRTIAQDS
jgi:signal transduction histidine kinase/CheY-like chemotaxis protein